MSTTRDRADVRLFGAILKHPLPVVCVMLVAILTAAVPLGSLRLDTRADAFLDADNPVLRYREVVRDQFGLSDPFFIAVVDTRPGGIYQPDTLALVSDLTAEISRLDNIDGARLVSLATEKNILGSAEGLAVQPLMDTVPVTASEAHALREAVDAFPLYRDSLVGPSGDATLIVAELFDEAESENTYREILAAVGERNPPPGVQVYVAGEGAIAGYLGAYIDADARRLIPLAGVIVLLVIVVAFRRLVPALLAFAIVLAAVFGSLGTMSLTGVPFYVITNALPVILVGISVADAIHILGRYEELRTESTDSTRQQLVVRTMCDMWRPVTATSLTTAAGFLGLYFASDMPPFRYFGLFAALGVMVAWFYSIFFLPAAMTLLEFRDNASRTRGGAGRDTFSVLMQALGHFTLSRPVMIIGIFAVLAVAGASAALQLQVDGDRISLFDQREPIRRADAAINKHLYGTNTLDIVVESVAPEGLLEPVNLRRIEALQRYVESLPHVTGSSSIVDYLKQMNRAMRGGEAQAYALPESSAMAAQYFLVYSMSSDPSDFEEEIDYDYRVANVRVTLNSGRYRDIGPVVNAIETYIEDEFNTDQISATQSGRVNLNYHWLKSVGESHFAGLVTSLLLVYCVAALLYRSPVAGVYALIPVCSSVLCVYAFMVVSGMTLEIGTSMFAAVSIGLGVDFAIHTLDRMRVLHKETGGDMPRMYKSFFCSTGRALLFNALAIACGFGVLVFSKVSQLSDFGSVVVLSMFVSFVASMTLVPALLLLLRPKFLASGSVR